MAAINIGGENAADPHYRYKMPKLAARIEGRGNGIKTNVVNNAEIAKALERPADYTLKYFGFELGAMVNYDKKSGNSIVNGAHEAGRLTELLEGFIKKFVQCYSCGNPETVIKVRKRNELIELKCKACGAVSDVSPKEKLVGYIIKNPPEDKLSKAEKKVKSKEKEALAGMDLGSDKKEKKEKKDKSKKKKKDGEANGEADAPDSPGEGMEEDTNDDAGDEVWMTDTSEEAMKRRAAEQLSAATAALVTQGNIEAEREAARLKAEQEAEAARLAAEEAERLAAETAEKLALEQAATDPNVWEIRTLVQDGKSSSSIAKAVAGLPVKGLPAQMSVLYEALFAKVLPSSKLAPLVAQHRKVLKASAAEPSAQLSQLLALEHLLAVTLPERMREAPLVLKQLYDCDVIPEHLVTAWYHKSDAASQLKVPAQEAARVREAAKPFVEWLEQETESESDDEE